MSWHNLVMYYKKPADVIQKYVKKGNPTSCCRSHCLSGVGR
jgi:single-stranded DNA-binding protein